MMKGMHLQNSQIKTIIADDMRTLTITAMLLTAMSCTSQTVWDITDYGAIGDSLSDNTLAINRTISLCSQAGDARFENVNISGS